MVKKTAKQEIASTVIVDVDELPGTSNEDQIYKELCDKLAEIRKDKSVIGYIIRNTTSATIDLNEPEKIVEYALFSSQVLDSSQEISDQFELGNVSSVLIKSKEKKAICTIIDGNKIGIFMKNSADHAEILKQISP